MKVMCMYDARIVATVNRLCRRVQLRHGMDVFSLFDAILWPTATVTFSVWVYGLYPVLHAENEWYVTFGVLQILFAMLVVWMYARGEQLLTAQARTIAYIASEQGVCNPVSKTALFVELRCRQTVLTALCVVCTVALLEYTVLMFAVAGLQCLHLVGLFVRASTPLTSREVETLKLC